jgi:hypothetical protein
MKHRRITALAATAVAVGGTLAGLAATSASAAPVNLPRPTPHVCAYNFSGGNILELTYLGNTYDYPVVLHESPDGLVTGFLLDKGLPPGHQVLRVDGACFRSNVTLDTEYGLPSVQGLRDETMRVTPISPHRGTAAGVWDETGTEAGSGASSLLFPVHRF